MTISLKAFSMAICLLLPPSVAFAHVTGITWSGGSLPHDFYDEFVFSANIAAGLDLNQPLYEPIAQQCERGANNWTQIAASGEAASRLKTPAPFIRLAAAAGPPAETRVGALEISQPWARATPGSAPVAGGYLRISNKGNQAERLLGASTDIAAGVEFHTMSIEDGIMKMRQLDAGLVIEPGASVELKPGGLHLMFTGLKRPLKQGENFEVTLIFEKAGSASFTFQVEALGAKAPAGSGNDHSGH